MNDSNSITARWGRWRVRCAARRCATPDDGFVGPVARPVWPAWVDADPVPRRRREPQRADPPRRMPVPPCGWFDSSRELRGGLEVIESEWFDLPSAGELDGQLQFL